MARGMCYLHDQSVAHRDIKPLNVVVNECKSSYLGNDFDVKLFDFGVLKTQVKASMANTMTAAGIGTTWYRAPEVHPKGHPNGVGKAAWFKADVYSFAMTCVHLLSLKLPFSGSVRLSDLYEELKNGRRPELPTNCPNELVSLLKECWDTNTSVRPPFLEICIRLEAFQHKLMRQLPTLDEGLSYKFISMKLEEQSSIQRPFVANIVPVPESEETMEVATNEDGKAVLQKRGAVMQRAEELKLEKNMVMLSMKKGKIPDVLPRINPNDLVSVIQCNAGHSLNLLDQPPVYYRNYPACNVCWKPAYGEVYHCRGCQFDAHPECAEIKERAEVFFHKHSLHLLGKYYYEDNPDAICNFCKQLVQHSEWVYRCDQCSFNAHTQCTKYENLLKIDKWLHPHKLTLVKRPIYDSMCCYRCKGDVNGYRYICSRGCPFELHQSCVILSGYQLCIFDCSTTLIFKEEPKNIYCGKCSTFEFSCFYHCTHCNVDVHIDCIDDTEEEEEEDDWNDAYDRFIDEYWFEDWSKDSLQRNVETIEWLVNNLLKLSETKIRVVEARLSSSSRPQPVPKGRTKVQPKAQKELVRQIHKCMALIAKSNPQEKEMTGIVERKVKKMAAKEALDEEKAKSMAEQDRKLKNLKLILQDLQNHANMSQTNTRILASTYEKLRMMQDIAHEVRTMQVKSKTRRVPRIILCSDVQKTFGGYITEVVLQLLCEEPGHEHVVPNVSGCKINRKNGKGWHRLQPFLATGLQVVANDLTSLLLNLTFSNKEPQEQSTMSMKRAENSAAHWLASYLESNRIRIFDAIGLSRVRYTVTEQRNVPRYKRGTLAWLCSEHLILGLKARTLEPCPMRMYHNQLLEDVQ